ncbi:UpxY family transcription antiterminator [Mucilaginibacter sp. ZT4R22]|uniref:UpxY family transcription antiterminator n=1 Tax=Mucilaginibacter pankratovii TaxID=2772110 RepID=A0ABR7WL93_9SPHI|nr:UpxY family transcription antiterminator [Mucilaginibacter pankratovii]MBD1363080.1 UpxY family transcription antiterminator [Mucilaginibacter pankratovii]
MNSANNDNWMVLYTRSRWEKKVDQLLKEQNIISYCPLVKTSKKWADRNKTVEIPLFNSYLFVRANYTDLEKITQTSGVITYVTFCGKPAIVRDNEIESIRKIVRKYSDIESIPLNDLQIGDEAIIADGPLCNQRGEVQQVNGKSVVMVLKSMNCALTVKIDSKELIAC